MEQDALNDHSRRPSPLHRKFAEDYVHFEVFTRETDQCGRWAPISISMGSYVHSAGLDFLLKVPNGKLYTNGSTCVLLMASAPDFPLCPRAFQLLS
jgi:hypothetical protein